MYPTSKESEDNKTTTTPEVIPEDIKSIKDAMMKMADKITELEETIKNHNHTGEDGTPRLQNGFELAPSEAIYLANFKLEERTNPIQGTDIQYGYMVVGKDKEDTKASKNTELIILNNNDTDTSTNQSFIYSYRYPLFTGAHGSVTSATSTFTTSEFKFTGSELVGSQLNVYDTDGTLNSFTITANTANTITVNGTWTFTNSNAAWIIFMPVYFGAADYPWRALYSGGDSVANNGSQRRALRFGYGPTSGTIGVYFGTGSPESVVTANVGSLYLRSDGGVSTSLYVKTSGTGTTGWTPK